LCTEICLAASSCSRNSSENESLTHAVMQCGWPAIPLLCACHTVASKCMHLYWPLSTRVRDTVLLTLSVGRPTPASVVSNESDYDVLRAITIFIVSDRRPNEVDVIESSVGF
jgi:hypothetical protein